MRKLILTFGSALLLLGIFCIGQSSAFYNSRDSNYNIAISSGCSAVLAVDGTPQTSAFGGSTVSMSWTTDDIIVAVQQLNASAGVTLTPPTSTHLGNFNLAAGSSLTPTTNQMAFWWVHATSSQAGETITNNNGGTGGSTFYVAVSGANTTSPQDGTSSFAANGPISFTPTFGNDFILSGLFNSSGSPDPGTFTLLPASAFGSGEYIIVNSATPVSAWPSFTSSNPVGIVGIKRAC